MINRPPNYNSMLFLYNIIKDNPNQKITKIDAAIVMIVEFQQAIERGVKHYHPETNLLLENVDAIIATLNKYGKVIIEFPKDDPNELLLKTNSVNDVLDIMWRGKL